jgi:hypothetical protein
MRNCIASSQIIPEWLQGYGEDQVAPSRMTNQNFYHLVSTWIAHHKLNVELIHRHRYAVRGDTVARGQPTSNPTAIDYATIRSGTAESQSR